MIEGLLPPGAVYVDSFTDRLDTPLFPQEEAVIARAVAKRRAEFTTVRACARDALAKLGHPPAPLLPGQRGAPRWPEGVVGSMTHCPGYRAAVVARADEVAALGIDAEPDAPLPDGVLKGIARPEDLIALAALPAGGPAWDRLLFSAKESVYKAWFPVGRRLLDFQEATVAIMPDGTFAARVLAPAPTLRGRPLTGFSGRWTAGNGLVLTSIAVEP
ncbi:4'-phosphopantetheinyl transferase family protein [Streptomyces sp. NEAU-W12]|uniref:4'-phosphopantetheinyl transferase family protein n=1 Tax=Streptomyces sp. NEAU-W12 TaxID=2994668 RepID=UPI00224B1523|nr:4'-phosphopantetheinyl transferase superfamily protein [Streptomyces sp. NEAU-W12]MCX2924145.1 4'-phosphopantetheinyl transferase superfamily protein [Streptomyces sp. NEAU-W12]